jgi:hypothetical protein
MELIWEKTTFKIGKTVDKKENLPIRVAIISNISCHVLTNDSIVNKLMLIRDSKNEEKQNLKDFCTVENSK